MKITILGSGTSIGVPVPLCQCAACTSIDTHDQRLRCSALVETDEGKDILIDCGPDFRMQALRTPIVHLEAVLLTHNHFDHCYGIDDLRPWAYFQTLPLYADTTMTQTLHLRWGYIFDHPYPGVPHLAVHTVQPDKESTFSIGQSTVTPIRCFHGQLPILGYRIDDMVYLTDCTRVHEDDIAKLQGIRLLILDALRWQAHPTHYCVEQALALAYQLQPAATYFTHISHDMGLHNDFPARLQATFATQYPTSFLSTIHLAYDGLILSL